MKFSTLFSLAIFVTPAAAFTATTCPSSINRMSGSSLAMGSPFFTSSIATALDKEVSELITLHWIVSNDERAKVWLAGSNGLVIFFERFELVASCLSQAFRRLRPEWLLPRSGL